MIDSNYYVGLFTQKYFPQYLGIDYKIIGKEHLIENEPVVYICNHQSSLDVISMSAVFPKNTVTMVKKELLSIPIFGWYMKRSKTAFIDRKNRVSAIETMETVYKQLKKDNVGIWLYPEGTRSHQTMNELLPFKKGAFHLAISGSIPIIPVVISTYGNTELPSS